MNDNSDSKNKRASSVIPIISSDKPVAFSRRTLLRTGISAGSAALLPLVAGSVAVAQIQTPAPAVLSADLDAVLKAFADRIIPPDANGPGAAESGVARYINRSLAEWNQNDVPLLSAGLEALDQAARARHDMTFATLSAEQQDALMISMEAGELPDFANAQQVFSRLYRLVLEGMFSDPYYGGNGNYAGWDLIGYPGAVLGSTAEMQQMNGRSPALHTSAYGEAHDGH